MTISRAALAALPSAAFCAAMVVALGSAAGCASCKKSDPSPVATSTDTAPETVPPAAPAGSAAVIAESLPRCRVEGARLVIPGDDVVAGDAVTTADAVLVGVVRREGTRRLASLVRASLDLASVKVIDVGTTLGDDPPPSPRMRGGTVFVASYARSKADGGAGAGTTTRVLEIARVEGTTLVREGGVVQQADESLAYDVAWPKEGAAAPLVAWDEDAPMAAEGAAPEARARTGQILADRGVVKVQIMGGARARVASPDTSDAEAPRLLARKGGYWLAWLARRPEAGEDAGAAPEGPGERRAYRWVELVALDAKGEATSPVRRVTPEKGRAASFDLAAAAPDASGGEPRLVVVVQDEAASSEGAGERIVRYVLDGQDGAAPKASPAPAGARPRDHVESSDLLDGGVGHALADLLALGDDARAPRWLAFTDTQEHAHLVPLGPALALAGMPTLEPALDGARMVASGPAAEVVYAVGPAGAAEAAPGSPRSAGDGTPGRVELRRLVCR